MRPAWSRGNGAAVKRGRPLSDQERANVARYVRAVLDVNEWSQEDFEETSKIEQSTISKMLNRKPNYGWDSVVQLAEWRNHNPLDIVSGTIRATSDRGGDVEHPERGQVLDRMRGILRQDALDRVRQTVLPPGVRLTTDQWARVLLRIVEELESKDKPAS